MVRTNLGRHFPRLRVALLLPFMMSPQQGAQPVIHLASAPTISAGRYYDRLRPVSSSPASYDTSTARRLWEITSDIRGPFG